MELAQGFMNCYNSNNRVWQGQGGRKEEMRGDRREREDKAITAMKKKTGRQTEHDHDIKERQRYQNPYALTSQLIFIGQF